MPRTQRHDVNSGFYTPDWTLDSGLIITPIVFIANVQLALSDPNLSFVWKRKDGTGVESNLITGESVTGNQLIVKANTLGSSITKILTYIAHVSFHDPETGDTVVASADIEFTLVQTGENAKSAWISGDQVFKFDADGLANPRQITLTGNMQNTTVDKWWYRNSAGNWVDYPTTPDNASIKGQTLIVKPTHDIFVGDMATIRLTSNVPGIEDVTSIYKVRDGQDGESGGVGASAPIAYLTNQAITFAANELGQLPYMEVYCNVVAYQGTTKVKPVIGTITGMPPGMTLLLAPVENNEIPL
jgi:hypothetical protein